MKYFILILFFSISVFSHESKKSHKDVSFQDLINLSHEQRRALSISMAKELTNKDKGNLKAEFAMIPISGVKMVDEKLGDWDKLTAIRSSAYWSLKALNTALKKGFCVGKALKLTSKHSEFFILSDPEIVKKLEKGLKFPFKIKDPSRFESLKNLKIVYYASKYMSSKVYLHALNFLPNSSWSFLPVKPSKHRYFLASSLSDEELIEKAIDLVLKEAKDISELEEKEQEKVWNLVFEWEKKWGENLYHPKDYEICFNEYLFSQDNEDSKQMQETALKIYLKN